jgi:hypothetical protein
MDDALVRKLLLEARTVAVVGMSRNPAKAAQRIPAYLSRIGFEVVPVNPFAEEILGRRAYAGLLDIPGHIDIVNVFRPSDEALPVVEEAVRRHKERGDVSMIWLQLGIANARARELAHAAGIPYIENHCLAVEIPRLFPDGLPT